MTSLIGSKGGSSSGSGVTTTEPWSAQQGSLKNIYGRAEQLFQGGMPSLYQNQMYAPRDAQTASAQNQMAQVGNRGVATKAAMEEVGRTASGYYLNSNPHLDKTFKRASEAFGTQFADTVGGSIGGRFGSSGRTGSPSEERAMGEAQKNYGRRLEDLSASIYGGNYEAERGRQLQASGMAGAVSAGRLSELGAAEGVGLSREQFAQTELDELVQRHDYSQESPYAALARYSQFIGQPVSTSSGFQKSKSKTGGSGILGLF